MTSREMVIALVAERMKAAFGKGDIIDAQNMEAFISSLERMNDAEYMELSEECSEPIT